MNAGKAAERGTLARRIRRAARRGLAVALFGLVVAGAVLAAVRVAGDLERNPRTSDAEIDADTMIVAAPLAGRIVALSARENAAVNEGDVLLRIDPEPYRLALSEARATLRAAEAALAEARRRSAAEVANAGSATEEIRRAEEDLALATRTVERLRPLVDQGYVSRQEFDEAVVAQANAEVSLAQARREARASRDLVETTTALEAEVEAAEAAVALARWELENTTVRAPFDGRVVGLSTTVGQYLLPGAPVFTLIDDTSWHAVALVRETDLAAVREGVRAEVTVAIDTGRTIDGTVESVGRGIQSGEDVDVAGRVPYVEATLDWVKVAKRFPVRIALEDPPAHLMRIGASAMVVLRTDERAPPAASPSPGDGEGDGDAEETVAGAAGGT